MNWSRGALCQALAPKPSRARIFWVGVDEVAQLCAGQGLVAEVVVTVDVFIPQRRIGAPVNEAETATPARHVRAARAAPGGPFLGSSVNGAGAFDSAVAAARWPIGLHAQHRDPAGHLFHPPSGFVPRQPLAGEAGQIGPGAGGVLGNQFADERQLVCTEDSATARLLPTGS